MLSKLISFNYSEARYIILKSLDTRDDIGQLLTYHHPYLALHFMQMSEQIDTWAGHPESELPDQCPIHNMDEVYLQDLMFTAQECLKNVILHSELNQWNEFVSALLIFATAYTDVLQAFNRHYCTPETDAFWAEINDTCVDLLKMLEGLSLVAQFGYSYMNLIQVANELVREIQDWKESRPTALKLSEAYLESIGFMPHENQGG